MADLVTYSVEDGIATLAMDDGKANAMAPAMTEALNKGLDRAAGEAKAVVIRGRAGILSGGFDLKIIRGDDPALRAKMRDMGMKLLERLYLSPQPVVIACPGHAVAMGAMMLLAADLRVGVRGDFRIGLNETAIGLPLPTHGLELARDRLMPTEFSHATINARLYGPDEATRVGYLDVVADADGFEAAVKEQAKLLADLDPEAFALTKKRVRQSTIDRIAARV
jgi:enoyl-CoA hydratase